ncbi:MAG: hydroxyethylthiazole kinase [Shewanella sp.]|nr:hydroxyethylthiazole kinase [Shewanella sp.]MCF1431180.1 hydroxyethylthiazole kinase [Shewanella sp.]MCF1439744.1 hydroxyethylthiazole kinase [Shewanella sp.]MCF1456190.1 hydroxyethylthiazole kinase [Shewanella sp.]
MTDPHHFVAQRLTQLRLRSPLVVNITNYVVMNNTANALLALGASPVMAHSHEEMDEMLNLASALVLNIGTPDRQWIDRMKYAAAQAVALDKPLVLDPVGCGATSLRTDTARELCDLAAPLGERFIIRGNASEVMALAGELCSTKGVDSQDPSDAALGAALSLHRKYQAQVVVSGATDYVVGQRVFKLTDGHPLMTRVTGMGCTLSALTGAFAALGDEQGLPCALSAAAVMGVVGLQVSNDSDGPGSFQYRFLDALYQLTPEQLAAEVNMLELL